MLTHHPLCPQAQGDALECHCPQLIAEAGFAPENRAEAELAVREILDTPEHERSPIDRYLGAKLEEYLREVAERPTKITFINVVDCVDPNDPAGRTYRQVNAATRHAIPIGTLVELDSGARLFVVKHTRDCDQEPLYSLATTPEEDDLSCWLHGYGERGLKVVRV